MISNFYKMDEHEKTEYLNREKGLMYVAMTRSINILMISGVGVKSEMITI